jgi:hypothetical protein
LLGFGEKDSYVIIDDVLISSEIVNPPVAGNDTLTYSWEFGDRTNPVTSLNNSQTQTWDDRGSYNLTVTVTDTWGGEVTQTVTVEVTQSCEGFGNINVVGGKAGGRRQKAEGNKFFN